jgi:hypothetical protein
MPVRLESLINNSIYHVFNRTIDGIKIFQDKKYSSLFLDTIFYYLSDDLEMSFSKQTSQLRRLIITSPPQSISGSKYLTRYYKFRRKKDRGDNNQFFIAPGSKSQKSLSNKTISDTELGIARAPSSNSPCSFA